MASSFKKKESGEKLSETSDNSLYANAVLIMHFSANQAIEQKNHICTEPHLI
jgi:hypothetical protein